MSERPLSELLHDAAVRAAQYRDAVTTRAVFPDPQAVESLAVFDEPLTASGSTSDEILELLDRVGSPATVAQPGGRYFGFVIGGSYPATLAANWLASAWDQNSAYIAMSPTAAKLEEVAARWLNELLGMPEGTGVGFVTGATMANFVGLAAARHAILGRHGWDAEDQGLFGAPPIDVVVGDEVHVSLLKALSMLGMGRSRVIRVPADSQGRFDARQLPRLNRDSIVCIQAGNVNTGAFDPAKEICERARESGSWVHVDGAFGLWAAATPVRSHLYDGFENADSWAVDAHKWLNVPYDCGIGFCRDALAMRAAMSATADYLIITQNREPAEFTPEMSRRARGVEIWAALRYLGRNGLAELVERCCRHATRFAEGLQAAGYEVLNDVVLNQVLVSFGSDARTRAVIRRIQDDGTCWCGGTVWQGRAAMRISVSSWMTTDDDVEQSLSAMIAAAQRPAADITTP
jgi:glutamate/tyrosine decarboxylase-like PLP-dependent enzyme